MIITIELEDSLKVKNVACDDPSLTIDKSFVKTLSAELNTFYTKARKKKVDTSLISTSAILDIRRKYYLQKYNNSFLGLFGKHQSQFYYTLAYRVAEGVISYDDVDSAFRMMESAISFSIMDFFSFFHTQTDKYTLSMCLFDFIYTMLDGKVAHSAEAKGIKTLLEWCTTGKTTLSEIEDCFLWMPKSGRGYKLSYNSLVAAMPEFDRVKVHNSYGRYEGKSLGFVPKEDTTKERLSTRNYDSIADKAKQVAANRKEALKGLLSK